MLGATLEADSHRPVAEQWGAQGRLVGEYLSGELAQVGSDVCDGLSAAEGTGVRTVRFSPAEPMGLGLCPMCTTESVTDGATKSVTDGDTESVTIESVTCGTGAEVGEVDEASAAKRGGIFPGCTLLSLRSVGSAGGLLELESLPFEDILAAIDARRDAGETLQVDFSTAAPVTRLYAVEMPAAPFLASAAAAASSSSGRPSGRAIGRRAKARAPAGGGGPLGSIQAGAAIDEMTRGAFLWREPFARAFVGQARRLWPMSP